MKPKVFDLILLTGVLLIGILIVAINIPYKDVAISCKEYVQDTVIYDEPESLITRATFVGCKKWEYERMSWYKFHIGRHPPR